VSVGLIVGVGDEGGLLVTTLRGEMVPHAAMKASSKRIRAQTDQPFRNEPERNFITKMMRSPSGLLATLAASRAERPGITYVTGLRRKPGLRSSATECDNAYMAKTTTLSWIFVLLMFATAGALAQGGSTSKNQSNTKMPNAPTAKTQAAPAKPEASPSPAANSPLKTDKEKVSYAIGMNIGANFKRQGIDVDPELFMQGIKDATSGSKTLLTEDEERAVLTKYQGELRARMQDEAKQAAETNKKAGEAFLAANKSKEGVVTLPSGLQYKILKEGTGPKPTASDTVECNYRGTLINGTEFDSTAKHGGQPAKFPVNGVIKGWTEALQLMPVGSKWQLFIPSDLAYGERGTPGGEIGPNSTLIFEVELLGIENKAADNKPEDKKPEEKK
jgi:FKBP-type peptidyl-prolyl cis-trans isomerase FklB